VTRRRPSYRRSYASWQFRRWWRRLSPAQRLGVTALSAAAVIAVVHGTAANRQRPPAITAASAPAPAGSWTPQSWAQAFLQAIPEPVSSCNLSAVEAWEQAEGGAWSDAAADNPLNTTQPEPGSWPVNADGVQAYPSWPQGLAANVTAITNGLYGGILAALRAGDSAQNVADQVAASDWGTSAFSASC